MTLGAVYVCVMQCMLSATVELDGHKRRPMSELKQAQDFEPGTKMSHKYGQSCNPFYVYQDEFGLPPGLYFLTVIFLNKFC